EIEIERAAGVIDRVRDLALGLDRDLVHLLPVIAVTIHRKLQVELSLRPLRTGAFPNEYCYHHEPLLAATAGAGVIPGLMGYSNPVVLSTAASATTSSAAAGVLNPAAMMAASGGLPAALALNPALIPGLNLNLMAQDKINRE
ncbi:MAG: hypothetical protein ACK53Y_05245, partial [bacterium]